MNLEERYDKIDRYLEGLMSEQESEQFEKELESNIELRKELSLHRGIRDAVLEEDIVDLETKINDVRSRSESKGKLRLNYKRIIVPLSIAASFLLVIGFAFLLNQSPDYNRIYDQYYEPFPNLISMRGDSEETMEKVSELYSNKEYREAIPILMELANSGEERASFYLAASYLELDQYEKAKDAFESHLEQYDYLNTQAKWYLALCYLRLDRIDESKEILNGIVDNNKEFADQGKELLNEIN